MVSEFLGKGPLGGGLARFYVYVYECIYLCMKECLSTHMKERNRTIMPS